MPPNQAHAAGGHLGSKERQILSNEEVAAPDVPIKNERRWDGS